MNRAQGRRDRGAATAMAAGFAVVLVTAATVAVLVAGMVLAAHRARAAADLAALAGAAAALDGLDACRAAQSVAQANDAEVTSCQLVGTVASFVVTVSVSAPTGYRSPLPVVVLAQARAGNAVG